MGGRILIKAFLAARQTDKQPDQYVDRASCIKPAVTTEMTSGELRFQ